MNLKDGSDTPYRILDNGAYENGTSLDISDLWLLGRTYGIQEVVLPDKLYDYKETLQLSLGAMEWIKRNNWHYHFMPNLMFVPQGKTVGEWAYCLYQFMAYQRYHPGYGPLAHAKIIIGMAKHTHRFPGGREGLIREYIVPLVEDYEDIQVHLLGWEDSMWNLKFIAQKYPFVRSIDSAQPYKYASYFRSLQQDVYPMQPLRRQADFFESKFTKDQEKMADYNMELFRQEARGVVVANAR